MRKSAEACAASVLQGMELELDRVARARAGGRALGGERQARGGHQMTCSGTSEERRACQCPMPAVRVHTKGASYEWGRRDARGAR